MDFFKYTDSTRFISEMFPGDMFPLWACMVVGGVCFLAVYVFQSIGLFAIARREGYKRKWMAFVPFFNTYYIGVCGQKNRFFNIDTKKIAVAAAIIEAVLFAVYALYYVSLFTLHTNNFFEKISSVDEWGDTDQIILPETFASEHPNFAWAGWCYNYLGIILNVLDLVYMFILVMILNCFFQTYSARHYFIFTIACIFFPIQGIMIFVVRNNKAMNYSEYVRSMQERAYRQYRDQQSFNNNPYDGGPGGQNVYGRPYEDGQNRQPPDGEPFSEYGRKKDDEPFSEYGRKKDDDPFDEFKN